MRTLKMRRQGFTLIEILVVIVIIGILATMGIGKYAQFSRDARKSGCQSNQNTIDKGVGMWETKYTPINPGNAAASMEFDLLGKKSDFTGTLPGRLTAAGTNYESEIFDMIQDDVVFACPETVNAYSGLDNISQSDKDTIRDYRWIMLFRGFQDSDAVNTGGRQRGVGCLVWGTVATSGTSDRGDAASKVPGGDGTVGPSGTSDDLHSGVAP